MASSSWQASQAQARTKASAGDSESQVVGGMFSLSLLASVNYTSDIEDSESLPTGSAIATICLSQHRI